MVRRALSALTLLALGCTGPIVTPSSTANDIGTPFSTTAPPTPAADELVLRMVVDEFPTPATLREPPEFSLYANGHVIYVDRQAQPANWQLRHAQLDMTAAEALLAEAVAALGDARESYDDVGPFDMSRHAPWTRFDVRTPEFRRSVSLYSLGEEDDEAPSRDVRARLNPLRERFLSFRREVGTGNAVDLGAYAPPAFLVELVEAPDELPDEIDWPWPTLDVRDFAQTESSSFARVMNPIELHAVLPFTSDAYLIAPAPSGGRYVIYVTPLLPGEPAV